MKSKDQIEEQQAPANADQQSSKTLGVDDATEFAKNALQFLLVNWNDGRELEKKFNEFANLMGQCETNVASYLLIEVINHQRKNTDENPFKYACIGDRLVSWSYKRGFKNGLENR